MVRYFWINVKSLERNMLKIDSLLNIAKDSQHITNQ